MVPGGGGEPPLAFPGVETNVVVISARRNEGCVAAVALGQLETEHAAVKPERTLKIRDLQVHMAYARAGVHGICRHWFYCG